MQAQLPTAYSLSFELYSIEDIMIFYRGQRMPKEEMNLLNEKRRTGSLITVNSYLSISISRDVAMSFIHKATNGEVIPVIFEISAELKDHTIVRRKPFAFIGHISHYQTVELEVLFSLGSFFRADDIKADEKEIIHIVQLTFIYDEDHCTVTDDYGTLKTCSLEKKLFKTGDHLFNHVKHGSIKAYSFYQHFLSNNYSVLVQAACHIGLAWLAFKEKKFDLALTHQEQALQIYNSSHNEACFELFVCYKL